MSHIYIDVKWKGVRCQNERYTKTHVCARRMMWEGMRRCNRWQGCTTTVHANGRGAGVGRGEGRGGRRE